MKKPPKYLTNIGGITMLILGAFSLPYEVEAFTVYQQLSDSSGGVAFDLLCSTGGYKQVGSFTVSTPFSLGTTEAIAFFVVQGGTTGTAFSDPQLAISSTTSLGGPFVAAYGLTESYLPGADYFVEMPGLQPGVVVPGHVYYIQACFSGGDAEPVITSNLSNDFFYGYITDEFRESLPIVPGIPGFTDFGISTTSQQAFCNQNFSTSSGLLDNLGQSISLGFCNVGVFLFVPSAQSLAQFQQLASTSQEKIPFSYFYDLQEVYQAQTASTTENLPSYSINLPAFGSSTAMGTIIPTKIDILSTTTIDTYLPTSLRETLLFAMASVLYIGTALVLYRRIVPKNAL